MKKFYFLNWVLLLFGLMSSTVFGQTSELNCPLGTIANNQMTFGITNFSIIHAKGTDTSFAAYSPWRVYTNNLVTIEGDSNVNRITSVVITAETSAYASAAIGGTISIISGTGVVTKSTSASTATISFSNDVTSFSIKPSAQTRWSKIKINYELKNTNQSPVVTAKTITGTYGVLLTDGTVTATNSPTSWTQSGNTPTGITFDAGVFSGTPTQAGSFTSQVTATNANGTSSPAEIKFEIAKANQTITGLVDLTQNSGTTHENLPSVTDKGLPIVYSSADNSIVSTSGNTLNFNAIGSTTITASALGNNNFNDYSTTFNVKSKDPNIIVYNGQGTFVKVNSLTEVTDGYYVVTDETNKFLMTNTLTSNYLVSNSVNVNNDMIIDPTISNVWKIETTNNGKTIYNEELEKFVGWETGNTVALASTVSAKYEWTFDYVSDKFTVNNVATPVRQLSYNKGNPRFVAYGNDGQEELQLYKLVTSTSTTWQNGAWSNGDPSLTKDVIIKGALEVSASLEAKTLTVSDAGGMLAVKPGGILTVDGKIDNQAGLTGLVIENGGNLIQNQNVANLGAISVNRNSQAMVRNDMTFWSSPVQQEAWQQTIRSFSPETLFNRFWTYNESTNEFSQILTSDTDSKLFEAGKGVSIRVKNTLATGDNTIQNGEFSGVPFNGDINVPVQFTASGYNLVGNPYASNINVVKFLVSNTSVNSLYFWTHQFPVGSAEYANNYAAFNVVGSVIPGLSNISVGQGFIVGLSQATPTVNFNNAMRTAQDAFFYKNAIAEKNRIWLSLSKENKPVSQILLAYMDGATNGIDNQIDAKVMQRGSSAIYTLINDEAYAIQGRSLPFATDDVVKLGFEALEQGNYSINIEQVDGLFTENQTVYLKDKELNKIYNLSESAYQFASKIGIFNDRFELVYADKTLATDDLTKNNVIVYNTNNTIVVDSKQSKIVSVELYDIQGRKVVDKNKINANTFQVQSSAKGVLVIKVLTEDGKVKTQKIINK